MIKPTITGDPGLGSGIYVPASNIPNLQRGKAAVRFGITDYALPQRELPVPIEELRAQPIWKRVTFRGNNDFFL